MAKNGRRWYVAAIAAAVLWGNTAAGMEIPVTGLELPELSLLDAAMVDVMSTHNIGAGMLAVMKDGITVYHRAFGWKDQARTQPLPLDTMMRLASVTKPLTAAAIRRLVQPGEFSLSDRVFDTTQQGAGLLNHLPFGTPDPRIHDIRVLHLLRHQGGWDRSIAGDHTYRERQIANEMGLSSPPGRDATLEWILGQPLQFNPGSRSAYSNIGYMILGMITEKLTGMSHIDVIRENVLAPIGISPDQIVHGRTFAQDQDPREPYYDNAGTTSTNVFFPASSALPFVPRPYGGWDQEARIGQGSVVASPLAILEFLDHYQVAGSNIGGPRPAPGNWRWTHTGSYSGTNAVATQRGDGINFVALFNRSQGSSEINSQLNAIFDAGLIESWPTTDVAIQPPPLLGDYNLDGRVDAADYVVWRDTVGTQEVVRWSGADGNGNGVIDSDDFLVWRQHFGASLPAGNTTSASVPEPSAMVLFLVGMAWSYHTRRPHRRRDTT